MKSMPLLKVTNANNITAKQAGAPGTSSSLPRLIKYVWYSSAWKLANVDFACVPQIQKIFDKHIYTKNQNLHYKQQCSLPKTPTIKNEIVTLIDQMLWKLENDYLNV